jgi:hypothetical protein
VLEIAEHRDERAELEGVMASGILSRAPHLISFLTYVCERYFEGESDQIKEYTIGVEALKRPPSFDPKKDSIVRVEAHRLRRRLNQYYAAEGAKHPIQIVIPNGQYVPQFVGRSAVVEAAFTPDPGSSGSDLDLDRPVDFPGKHSARSNVLPKRLRKYLTISALLFLCLVVSSVTWRFTHVRVTPEASIKPDETWAGKATLPVPTEFRMLAGYHGAAFIDSQGRKWDSDKYFVGGHSSAVSSAHPIKGVSDPNLLQTQRSGEFRYEIPLAKSTHELRLYFAETEFGSGNPGGGSETARLFDISINGSEAIKWFDAIAEAGGANQLVVRVWKDIVPAADGKLHVAFRPAPDVNRPLSPAFVNAIEILQSVPGRIEPVRIVAQGQPVLDNDGRHWSADQYFFGGNRVFRNTGVIQARDQGLYRGERYGNFSYHIPLVPGKYRLTMHFAETWFGTPESRAPALDSRRFNVFANGAILLNNFEIAKEGGVNHEVIKVFDNLEPNAQGALWLEFVPVENYAEVNAIEVEQTE